MRAAKKLHFKSGTKGKRWMNNGVVQKPILSEETQIYLDLGWEFGTLKSTSEKANNTKKLRGVKTPPNKGKVAVHNSENKLIYVNQIELEQYLQDGWIKGGPKRR